MPPASRHPHGWVAEALRTALAPYVRCSALVIFTEDCTGRPQKKAGAEHIISRVSLDELDAIRSTLPDLAPRHATELIAGEPRPVLAARSATNALLVLTDPSPAAGWPHEAAMPAVVRLWHLAAVRIRDKVAEAAPSYLRESRAASAERSRLTAELTDQHSTTLETVLAALRSPHEPDEPARRAATDIAAAALVRLRASADRAASLLEEPVARAFERLQGELRPLERFSGISPASSGTATGRTSSSTSATTGREASRPRTTACGASSSASRPSTEGSGSRQCRDGARMSSCPCPSTRRSPHPARRRNGGWASARNRSSSSSRGAIAVAAEVRQSGARA